MIAVMKPRFAPASVSEPLCESTARAAIDFAAGKATGSVVSTVASTLARGVLRSMLGQKLRFLTRTILLFAAVAAGAGLVGQSLWSKAGTAVSAVASSRVGCAA